MAPAVLRTVRLLRASAADAARRRGASALLPPLPAAAQRLYLQRDAAPSREHHHDNAVGRRMHKEAAVAAAAAAAAAAKGYVSLRLGRASLLDKTQALRGARRVVAHVGASALHLLFAGVAAGAAWLFVDATGAGPIGAHWAVCVASALWAEPPRAYLLRPQPGVSADGVDAALLRAAVAQLDAVGEQGEQGEQGGGGGRARLIERLECDRSMTTAAPTGRS